MRVDVVSGKARKLITVLLSLTLIMGIITVAVALQDMVWTYSDSAHTVEAATFGDGDTVYLKITDSETNGGTKSITVENNTIGNTIDVNVTDDNSDSFYFGSFVIHSEANDEANDKLTMFDGQTATITANLDGDANEGTATITADYVTALQDNIWTYSDPTYIVEETEFGDGDTVYVKVTDTVTKGGTRPITVQNNDKWNEILVDVVDSNSDSFYYGSFVVYSGANDDVNDKLGLFYGETATITADLANDGTPGTKIIYAAYISPPPTNLTATAIVAGSIRLDWTASSPETNVSQYNIYRAITTQGQNFASPLNNVSAGTTTYTDSATSDGVIYYYVVRAQDAVGNIETNTNEAIATADGTAPPSPSNLTATATPGLSIELSWTDSTPEDEVTDVSQYNIYRATSSGGQSYSSPTYTAPWGVTSYIDSSCTDSQTYYYVVRAQDAAGNVETNTNETSTTAFGDLPPPPTNLVATATAGGNIQLSWIASSPQTNVSQYNIYRAITSKGQNFASPLTNVSAGTTTYTDSATSDGVIYYYVVRAQDDIGNIETNTNEATATADDTPPPSPSNLAAAPITEGGIQLTWTASVSETDVSQYNIYRATSSGGQNYSSPTYTVSVGITSYTDSSATSDQTYYYVVRAQDAAGNTDSNTNEAWATAGFAFSVEEIYTEYQDSLLCDLASSTDRYNPTAFTKGKIDEIYLKVNLLGAASLNESSSSIALYKLVNNETEEVLGSQQVNQGTGWAELSFHLDSEFDPDLDQHSRDGLYWVDIRVVDTAANSGDYDFYFVYDTISPSIPGFGTTSLDPAVGYITVSGTTVPDELSDPQQVEVFLNDVSQGSVTADANYQFIKSNIALASGTNSVEVQSTDRAGNKSELSETWKLDYNPVGLLSAVFRSLHVVKSGSSIDIIYSVTQPAQITIQVFNLSGEIVKEWQGSVSSDIENRWTWHGRNMYEQEVNNGVYICKINAQASDGTSEQKIKLLAVVR